MKLPLPRDFFAPVRLEPQEARQLKLVETQLLEGYLRSYEEFTAAQAADEQAEGRRHRKNGHVATSSGSWTFVRQQNGLRIFRKLPQAASPPPPPARPGRKPRRPPPHRHAEHSRLPGVIVTGTVDGTVEELLYGSMWHSASERAARSFFTRDGVADAAVLHTVEQPTAVDPWRSLAVKWALKRGAGLFVKDRDVCYLAASGMVQTSAGTKVGYRVRHSMTFPSCPPFQNRSVVRAQVFFCSIFRQLKHGCIEIFHQGAYDAGGGLLRSVAERAVLATLMLSERVPQFATAKKLSRSIQWSEQQRLSSALSMLSVDESFDGERRCGVCLDALDDEDGVYHRSNPRRCAICMHHVCSRCSTRREVELDRYRIHRALARCICKHCVAKVLRDDATLYAVRDANEWTERVRSAHASRRRNSRWGHDDIDDEFPGHPEGRRHSVTLFASDSCTFQVEDPPTSPSSRHRRNTIAATAPIPLTAVRQESIPRVASANTAGMAWNSRERSATAPLVMQPVESDDEGGSSDSDNATTPHLMRHYSHQSLTAPPILLRSDAGRRNWHSSTSALSLVSSSRSSSDGRGVRNGIAIPHHVRHHRRRPRRFSSSSASSRSTESARASSFSSNSSSSSTVLVSLSSRGVGLPVRPRKRVEFQPTVSSSRFADTATPGFRHALP